MAVTTREGLQPAKSRPLFKPETILFYLCISPWLLGFIIFTAGPMIYSLWLSFQRWDLFTSPVPVGLNNYITMFTEDQDFWQGLKVTFTYTLVRVPLGMVAALAVALLMNQAVKGINFFRTIYYLPSIMPGIAVAVLWTWVFNPEFGVLNTILSWFGIRGPGWIADPNWALPALIIMSLWGIGGTMIIYLAGLKSIPSILYEAAELDGAGPWTKFTSITLPQLSPTIFFNLVMTIIGAFQVFTEAYVMTNGGPQKATFFYMFYLYTTAFQSFQMGYGAAMAWILFVIILILTMLVLRSSAVWVYYESERK